MFNKLAFVILGLTASVTSIGCCCFGGYPYGSGYRAGGCAPCNNGCAPQGQYYPPAQGAFYSGGATQTAYVDPNQAAFAPVSNAYMPSASAYVPTSTALAPIQGPPIYNTAVIPTATLPMY
jgi:hypothetical protein